MIKKKRSPIIVAMKKTKAITKERTDAANERENFEGKKMTTISNNIAMKKLAITCAISAMAFMLCGCATTPTKSREEMDNTQASLASITDEHSEDKKLVEGVELRLNQEMQNAAGDVYKEVEVLEEAIASVIRCSVHAENAEYVNYFENTVIVLSREKSKRTETIALLEEAYKRYIESTQSAFIGKMVKNDFDLAKEYLKSGMGRFFNNKKEIAKAIPHMDRIISTDVRKYPVLGDKKDTRELLAECESKLWPWERRKAHSVKLQPYHELPKYPQPDEQEMREFVNAHYNQPLLKLENAEMKIVNR